MNRTLFCVLLLLLIVVSAFSACQAEENTSASLPPNSLPGILTSKSSEEASYVVRNPLFASALSALLPGGGQFFNNQPVKGALIIGAETLGALAVINSMLAHEVSPTELILPIVYVASIIDAGWSAHSNNQRMAAAGFTPQAPPEVSPRITVGVRYLIGTNELSGLVGEVEWRPTPPLGVSVAHSSRAGSLGKDSLTLGDLRLYLNSTSPHQVYIGWEYGLQERSSGDLNPFKCIYNGATAGVTLRSPSLPLELRASFGSGSSSEGIAGFFSKGPYGRWAGGLALVF